MQVDTQKMLPQHPKFNSVQLTVPHYTQLDNPRMAQPQPQHIVNADLIESFKE